MASTTTVELSALQAEIAEALHSYAQTQIKQAHRLHPAYGRLWEAIDRQLQAGGKRLRPYLVLLSYQAYGGKQHSSAIIGPAMAWELLHIGLLMHDDIIDRDYTRHGQPNIAGTYQEYYQSIGNDLDRTHAAQGAMLLAGDLLLGEAQTLLATSRFPNPKRQEAGAIMRTALYTVIGGELLDSEAALDTSIDPLLVAEAKTASYSVVGPLLSGAVLAGADVSDKKRLAELGKLLGLGYQIVDDILGIFGNEAETGKSVSSDLAEGKRSFVVLKSLELMTPSARKEAEELLAKRNQAAVRPLKKLIEATDIDAHVARTLMAYKHQAEAIIAKLDISADYQTTFLKLIDTLLNRRF